MARISTPETRAYARDKAEVIGAAERVIYGEIRLSRSGFRLP